MMQAMLKSYTICHSLKVLASYPSQVSMRLRFNMVQAIIVKRAEGLLAGPDQVRQEGLLAPALIVYVHVVIVIWVQLVLHESLVHVQQVHVLQVQRHGLSVVAHVGEHALQLLGLAVWGHSHRGHRDSAIIHTRDHP